MNHSVSLDVLSSPVLCVNLSCMTITQLLKDHFDSTGEAQAVFARRVGLTPQVINQLLKGDIKVPSAQIRRTLAKAFGLRHVDILVMVGELSEDEIPVEGKPRELFAQGTAKAEVVKELIPMREDQALQVASFAKWIANPPEVNIPVIVRDHARR